MNGLQHRIQIQNEQIAGLRDEKTRIKTDNAHLHKQMTAMQIAMINMTNRVTEWEQTHEHAHAEYRDAQ